MKARIFEVHRIFFLVALVVGNSLCAIASIFPESSNANAPEVVVVSPDNALPLSGRMPAPLPSSDGEELDDDDTSSRDHASMLQRFVKLPALKLHITLTLGMPLGSPEVNTPPPRA